MDFDLALVRPRWDNSGVSYPLGLMYIQAYCKRLGFTVRLFDELYEPLELFWRLVEAGEVSVVGISMLSRLREGGYDIVRKVKKLDPGVKVVLGGIHASSLPKLLVDNLPVDAAVIGEGEVTMRELLDLWVHHIGTIQDVRGIATREYGLHASRALVQDLDRLPFPDMSDINPANFKPPIAQLKPNFTINGVTLGQSVSANMITSRGCLGRCLFCNAWQHWAGKVRFRSAKNVVDEILDRQLNYGVNMIEFHDDCLAQNRQIMVDICQRILDDHIRVAWYSAIRPDVVDLELLHIMHDAGCFMLAYGVESGSQFVLDNIGKRTTKRDIANAIELTKKAGIKAYALLMVGNLGETDATIDETVRFMNEVKPDLHSAIGKVWVYPDTAYARLMGIQDKFWLSGNEMPFFQQGFSLDDCDRWRARIDAEVPKPWLQET